jgi:general secretion pathway protein L
VRETLYLRLRDPDLDAPTAHALVVDLAPTVGVPPSVFVRELPLREVLALATGRRVVAFVPGADVRLTTVTVPARQPAKVLQAAPFVLEDQFADDVEMLHFALGTRLANGAFPIAAVARNQMVEWLVPFRATDVRIDALIPETLALPWQEGGPWTVLAESDQATCRTSASGGFSCAPEDFELFLQMAEAGDAHPLRIYLPKGVRDDYSHLQRPIDLLPGFDDPLEALVRSWRAAASINLLQGPYSQREDLDRFWKPWRLAAGLVIAAFVLGVANNGIQALRLKHQALAQAAANEAQFRRLFPRETRIVDLQAQLDQQLRALRAGNGGGGLFFLLQQAAAGLAASPGLTLKDAQFREGALYLDLGSSDLQAAEKLRAYFSTHRGATLTVQDTNAGDGAAQIRVKLAPGAL